jgi:N-acetylneuraminate synthase
MMERSFDFDELFVLDLANNHQGDVEHGLSIIRSVAEVVRRREVRAGIKFQFRALDSFVHPAHREGSDNKHIPRFLSTRLSRRQFEKLLAEVRRQGLITICTPFDEDSVGDILDMEFDIVKVASCSASDWPLLETIADSGKPVIVSTGGLGLSDVDNLHSFFDHRGVDFAMMHCVSIYPTPDVDCHLNQVDVFRRRFPGRVIGWSTHEEPDNLAPVMVAVAKGARMFERHIGLATSAYKLNAYSSSPEQLDRWLSAYRQARELCGPDRMPNRPKVETDSILGLQRGIYAKTPIKGGTAIIRERIYFAMPCLEGQLPSGRWKEGILAKRDLDSDGAIMEGDITLPPPPPDLHIKHVVHDVKALLNEARVPLNSEFEIEYSHHHGMENFRETGVVIINCINREYCKKILVQLPGQSHPSHFHRLKEETFQVLSGELNIEVGGHQKVLHPGETCLIQPGVFHSFWTETGCVFEEVSTTHYNNDSFYRDKTINKIPRHDRKTVVDHWGRFQVSLRARQFEA